MDYEIKSQQLNVSVNLIQVLLILVPYIILSRIHD